MTFDGDDGRVLKSCWDTFAILSYFLSSTEVRSIVVLRIMYACLRFVGKDRPSNLTIWYLSCDGVQRRN